MPRSARKVKKSVRKTAKRSTKRRSPKKSQRSSRRVHKSPVRKTSKKTKKSVSRSYRLGTSPYQSLRVDVTVMSGETFTFYTDCKSDNIGNVKLELEKIPFFKKKAASKNTIRLMNNDTGEEMDDDESITRNLSLRLVIAYPNIAKFPNKYDSNDMSINLTDEEIQAYMNAINGEDDPLYTYGKPSSTFPGPDVFLFTNKINGTTFTIANETTGGKIGPLIANAYSVKKQKEAFDKLKIENAAKAVLCNKRWYTARPPYNNIDGSDGHARSICESYNKDGPKSLYGDGKDVVVVRNDRHGKHVDDPWTFRNVNLIKNNLNEQIFSYTSNSNGTNYVIGVPHISTTNPTPQQSLEHALRLLSEL